MFIFVIALINNRTEVSVIDINYDCLHEKYEYATINEEEYFEIEEAISKAREYAKKEGVKYRPFIARHRNHIAFKE